MSSTEEAKADADEDQLENKTETLEVLAENGADGDAEEAILEDDAGAEFDEDEYDENGVNDRIHDENDVDGDDVDLGENQRYAESAEADDDDDDDVNDVSAGDEFDAESKGDPSVEKVDAKCDAVAASSAPPPVMQGRPQEESLVVHVDDAQDDLDADLGPASSAATPQKIEGKDDAVGKAKNVESATTTTSGSGKSDDAGEKETSSPVGKAGAGKESAGLGVGVERSDSKGDGKAKIRREDGPELDSATSKPDDKSAKDDGKEKDLWISNLSSTTRATDLKQIFSKHGKVVGAKVMTNAKIPGSRCYGYVSMATIADAEKCIEKFHKTEIHGRTITVEKATSIKLSGPTRSSGSPQKSTPSKERKSSGHSPREEKDGKRKDSKVETSPTTSGENKKETKATVKTPSKALLKTPGKAGAKAPAKTPIKKLMDAPIKDDTLARQRMINARERDRIKRLEFNLKKERQRLDRDRLRDRQRFDREMKYIKDERLRLRRESLTLKKARETLVKEREEMNRLERERAKLERERRERERLEHEREKERLKAEKMRLQEERRAVKRTLDDTYIGTPSARDRCHSGEPSAKKPNYGEAERRFNQSPGRASQKGSAFGRHGMVGDASNVSSNRKSGPRSSSHDRMGRSIGSRNLGTKSSVPKNSAARHVDDGRSLGSHSTMPKLNGKFSRPRGGLSPRTQNGMDKSRGADILPARGPNARHSSYGQLGQRFSDGAVGGAAATGSIAESYSMVGQKPSWAGSAPKRPAGPPNSVVAAGFVRGSTARGGRERFSRGGRGGGRGFRR